MDWARLSTTAMTKETPVSWIFSCVWLAREFRTSSSSPIRASRSSMAKPSSTSSSGIWTSWDCRAIASSTFVSICSRIRGVTRRAAGAARVFAMMAAPTRATITTANPARARKRPLWAP